MSGLNMALAANGSQEFKDLVVKIVGSGPKLSEPELLELNKLIIHTVNEQRRQKARNEGLKFHFGQKVAFVHNGASIVGTVKTVNDKTCTVEVEGSRPWRVAFSLLTILGG